MFTSGSEVIQATVGASVDLSPSGLVHQHTVEHISLEVFGFTSGSEVIQSFVGTPPDLPGWITSEQIDDQIRVRWGAVGTEQTTLYIRVGGVFAGKPSRVRINGAFVDCQVQVKVNGSFVNA